MKDASDAVVGRAIEIEWDDRIRDGVVSLADLVGGPHGDAFDLDVTPSGRLWAWRVWRNGIPIGSGRSRSRSMAKDRAAGHCRAAIEGLEREVARDTIRRAGA